VWATGELADINDEHYSKFGDKLPKELTEELDALEARLNNQGRCNGSK
jgi:phosphoenolpyruvate carboxykinase (GTP)